MLRAGALAAACGLACPLAANANNQPITRIALTGDAAPGIPGANFAVGIDDGAFSSAMIANNGVVSFSGRIAGAGSTFGMSDRGVFAGTQLSTLGLVVRGGSTAPDGTASFFFNGSPAPSLNNSGLHGFTSFLTGGGSTVNTDSGVFAGTVPASTASLAREGSAASGLPANVNYGSTNGTTNGFSPVLINDAGAVAFRSPLTGTGVTDLNNEALFVGAAPTLRARKGSLAAGFTNVNYGQFFGQSLNGNGQLTFRASLNNNVAAQNDQAIFSTGPAGNFLIAREGNGAPGATGAQFGGAGLGTEIGEPSINNNGRVVFRSPLTGSVSNQNDSGVWGGVPGTTGFLTLVQREGNPASFIAVGIAFDSFDDPICSDPAINANNRLATIAKLRSGGVNAANDYAIVTGTNLTTLVAREGSLAPVGLPGVAFSLFNDGAGVAPAINAIDQILFKATLTGSGVTAANDTGLFGWDPIGGLCMLVREGQLLDVNGAGDFRTVTDLSAVLGSGGQDGRARALADDGRVVFTARFSDGTGGVFVTNVPTPSPAALLALAGVFMARRRRGGFARRSP